MKQDQLNGYPPWFTDSVLKCRETVIWEKRKNHLVFCLSSAWGEFLKSSNV
jgi:hypothetical protein